MLLIIGGVLIAILAVAMPTGWLAGPDADDALLWGVWLLRGATLTLGAGGVAFGLGMRRSPEAAAPARLPVPWIPLAGILSVALGLRLLGLESDLWYDEVVTLTEFVRIPFGDLLTTYTVQNNHVLYSLLAKSSTSLFGESAWALRLPAALFGVACVGGVFFFARRVADDRQALLSAALIAVAYHHVWFSQNARGYTGLMFLGLIASGLLLDGLRQPRRQLWLAYGAVAATAMYVHLSFVFLLFSHGLIYLGLGLWTLRSPAAAARYPGARDFWPLTGFVLGGLLSVELYALVLPQMLETFGNTLATTGSHPQVDTWRSPLWTVLEIIRNLPGGVVTQAGLFAGAIAAAWALFQLLRRDPASALVMALPAPVTLAVLLFYSHIWPRYFFQYMGFAAVLLVHGSFLVAPWLLKRLGRSPAGGRSLASALVGVLILATTTALPRNYDLPKQPFRQAREYVEANRIAGERVATVGLASLPYERLYAPEWSAVADAAELVELQAGSPGTWVVYSFPTYMKVAHPDVLELTASQYEECRIFPGTVGDGALYVWHRSARDQAHCPGLPASRATRSGT